MIAQLALTLEPREVVSLSQLDPLLYQLHASASVQDCLKACLETLAGRRTYATLVIEALKNGDAERALRLGAHALQRGRPLSDDARSGIEALWSDVCEQAEKDRMHAHQALGSLPKSAFESLVRDVREQLETKVPRELPSTAEDLDLALHARRQVSEARKNAEYLVEQVPADLAEKKERLRERSMAALARVLGLDPGEYGAASATLLRALPELILSGREEILARIADSRVSLADPALQAEVVGFGGGARFVRRPSQPMNSKTRFQDKLELSAITRRLTEQASAASGLESAADYHRLRDRSRQEASFEALSNMWLSAAAATTEESLRAAATGWGLLFASRQSLLEDRTKFATEYSKDALCCFHKAGALGDTEGIELAALSLAAARVWPRFRAVVGDATLQTLASWLREPAPMFSWIAEKVQLQLLAGLWADLHRPEVASRFFAAIEPHCDWDGALQLACAKEVSAAYRLVQDPDASIGHIKLLLEGFDPSEALLAALDRVAGELASVAQRTPAGRRALRGLAQELEPLLAALPRNAGIEPILELPAVLGRMAERTTDSIEPHLSFRPLVRTLLPEERCDGIHLSLVVHNHEDGAPAAGVVVRLAVSDEAGELRLDGCSRVAEKEIGGIDPGEERLVTFLLDLPDSLVGHALDVRFKVTLSSGFRELKDEKNTFTLQLRPGNRQTITSPYSTGQAIGDRHFIGREIEMKEVLDSILGQELRTPLVYGIRRIGKTSLLKKVMECTDVKRRFSVVYASCEDRPDSETSSNYLHYLAERIRTALPFTVQSGLAVPQQEFEEDPYAAFERFVLLLDARKLERQVLIVFDEFDRLLELVRRTERREAASQEPLQPRQVFQPQVLGALRKVLMTSRTVRMIFAGLPTILHTDYKQRLFGLLYNVQIRSFSKSEANKILDAVGNAYEYTAEARQRILEATGLQPYLLQVVCNHVFTHMVCSGRDRVTPLDVQSVIQEKILPHEKTFTDYLDLVHGAEEHDLLVATASAVHGSSRRFATVPEVRRELVRSGYDVTPEWIEERLTSMTATDRPLVQHADNAHNRFQLVIGLLGELLLRKAAR